MKIFNNDYIDGYILNDILKLFYILNRQLIWHILINIQLKLKLMQQFLVRHLQLNLNNLHSRVKTIIVII